MITAALTISIILASSTLSVGYGLGGFWAPAAAVLMLGALWILGQRMDWSWIAWPMAALLAVAAAVGGSLGVNPMLLLTGLTAALSGWELDDFARQLDGVDAVEHEGALKRRHLQRLATADGLALLSGFLALVVKVRLSFGVAVVLGLVALIALSRAMGFFRRESG